VDEGSDASGSNRALDFAISSVQLTILVDTASRNGLIGIAEARQLRGQAFRLAIAIEENARKSMLTLLVALPWLKAQAYAAFEAASQVHIRRPLLKQNRGLGFQYGEEGTDRQILDDLADQSGAVDARVGGRTALQPTSANARH
jgi:hypothetical protein